MNVQTKTFLAVAAGVGVVLVVLKEKFPDIAAGLLKRVNPANKENAFYTGVNRIGQAYTGDNVWNLGARLAEYMNPGMVEAERAALAPVYPRTVTDRDDDDMGMSIDSLIGGGDSLATQRLRGAQTEYLF